MKYTKVKEKELEQSDRKQKNMKIKTLVNRLIQECIDSGADWKDVDVMFRRSSDSDVHEIGRIEQDLFDAQTNRTLTSVMLFPTRANPTPRPKPVILIDKPELESILDCASLEEKDWDGFREYLMADTELVSRIDQMVLGKAREWVDTQNITLPL